MQRVLDPAQIEAFAQRAVARIRLPDAARIFAKRAARLRELSQGHAVGDYLRLMAALADAQQSVVNLPAGPDEWHPVLHELCNAIAGVPGFPAAVTQVCRNLQALPLEKLQAQADLLLREAAAPADSVDAAFAIDAASAPFIMAALQVHWVRKVGSWSPDQVNEHIGHAEASRACPVCGTLPVASIVSAEKAHQGYRYLHCALCATEWHMVRVKCSHCESTAGIHYHSIEGGSTAIRAEACDHCKTYRKICYQEQDLSVEPLADDLASLAIDLLMSEEGFQRASGNPLLWQ